VTQQPYYQDRVQFGGPSKPKRRAWPWVLLGTGLLLFVCIGGIVAATGGNAPRNAAVAPVPDDTSAPAASAPAKAPATAATVGEGSWEVGTEVKPGTYTTTVGADSHCYWARLKAFDGDFDAIIANGNLDSGEHGRITVKKTDKGLQLDGDCVWKLAGAK
jgi:hypothetical protein